MDVSGHRASPRGHACHCPGGTDVDLRQTRLRRDNVEGRNVHGGGNTTGTPIPAIRSLGIGNVYNRLNRPGSMLPIQQPPAPTGSQEFD